MSSTSPFPLMKALLFPLAALLLSQPVAAQTLVSEPWARGTVAAQKASGAFLQLRSPDAARLVGASSPLAGRVEIHEMKMADGVMQMRQITALELPAGQTVELKPGGYHLMLMELKQPLKAGEQLPLELRVERAGKPVERLKLSLPVRALGGHGHGH